MQIEGKPVTRQMLDTARAPWYTDKKRSCRMTPVTFSKFCTKNERAALCSVGCLPIGPCSEKRLTLTAGTPGSPRSSSRQLHEVPEETALKATETAGPRRNSQRKLRRHELPGSWIAPQDSRPGSSTPQVVEKQCRGLTPAETPGRARTRCPSVPCLRTPRFRRGGYLATTLLVGPRAKTFSRAPR